MKKIALKTVLFAMWCLLCSVAVMNSHAFAESTNSINIGDKVYFGEYYYRNVIDKEPLQWRVLAEDGDSYLLLTEKIIEKRAYHGWTIDCWDSSDIRIWLNGEFVDTAFANEKSDLIETTISSRKLTNPNAIHSLEYSLVETNDKVWLLDEQDAENLSYGFESDKSREAYYAPRLSKNEEAGRWFLRGYPYVYYGVTFVKTVNPNGSIKFTTNNVYDSNNSPCYAEGIRPVIRVKKSSAFLYREDPRVDGLEKAKGICYKGKKYEKETGEGEILIEIDEQDFANSSYTYNHKLAQFGISMSTLMYNDTDDKDYKKGLDNIERALGALGYNRDTFYEKLTFDNAYEGNESPFIIASKEINLDGNKTAIVGVYIRGTYQQEWINNFEIGNNSRDNHNGFEGAATTIENALKKYIKNNNLDKEDIKLFITGHSRGAAVANLLGARLNNNITATKNIFVYTFATPNTTKASKSTREGSNYKNIFNIVNPEDFVTKVVPAKWGYGRYGVTYSLPTSTGNTNVRYYSYLKKIQASYAEVCPDFAGYKPYPNGIKDVNKYVSGITKKITSVDSYYRATIGAYKDYSTLRQLFIKVLAYSCCNKHKWEGLLNAVRALDGVVWGDLGRDTSLFFIKNHAVSKYFDWAHRTDTYYSAMVSNISETELTKKKKMVIGTVNSTVNLIAKNNKNEIVGEIKNDQINDNIENSIYMDVNGDSKTFYLMEDGQSYNIELTGNDNGTMDYSLAEVDFDTGEISRTLYQSIPVSKGKTVIQSVSIEEKDVVIDDLKDEDNNVIAESKVFGEDDLGELSVDVTVEGVGYAGGFRSLTPGDYVELVAVTDENNEFLGWYDDTEELVTKESELSFTVLENKKFVAKFTNNIVNVEEISFEKNFVNVDAGEFVQNEATVLPENATNDMLTYESSNQNVVEVNEFGELIAKKEGIAHITATSSSGNVMSGFDVAVGDMLEIDKLTDLKVEKASGRCNAYANFRPDKDMLYNFEYEGTGYMYCSDSNGKSVNMGELKKDKLYRIRFSLDSNYEKETVSVKVSEKILSHIHIDEEKSNKIFNDIKDITCDDIRFVMVFDDDSEKVIDDFSIEEYVELNDDEEDNDEKESNKYGRKKIVVSAAVNGTEYSDYLYILIIPNNEIKDRITDCSKIESYYDEDYDYKYIYLKFVSEDAGFYQFETSDKRSMKVVDKGGNRLSYWSHHYESDDNWYCINLSKNTEYYLKIRGYDFDGTVTVEKVECDSIKLNKSELQMNIGETTILPATISPGDSKVKIRYYVMLNDHVMSKDGNIIKVDDSGKITAKAVGKEKVCVETSTGESDYCDVTVVSKGSNNTNTLSPSTTSMPSVRSTPAPYTLPTFKVKAPGKVNLKKAKALGKKKVKVSWKWSASQDGYQLQYAMNRSFTKNRKTQNKSAMADTATIKNLKKGKTYYFRVRAYRARYYGGKKYGKWGKWSNVKKCRVK